MRYQWYLCNHNTINSQTANNNNRAPANMVATGTPVLPWSLLLPGQMESHCKALIVLGVWRRVGGSPPPTHTAPAPTPPPPCLCLRRRVMAMLEASWC